MAIMNMRDPAKDVHSVHGLAKIKRFEGSCSVNKPTKKAVTASCAESRPARAHQGTTRRRIKAWNTFCKGTADQLRSCIPHIHMTMCWQPHEQSHILQMLDCCY